MRGMGERTFIIAEAGVNHNGSLENALSLIDAAAHARADAVKFQTFKSEKVISRFATKAEYQIKSTGGSESQLEMVKKLELDKTAHKKLVDHCTSRGIQFLSTPFDLESLDFLVQDLNLSKIKIPSGEITTGPLLLSAARSGKPVILSTGMSTLGEVEVALGVLAFGYISKKTVRPSILEFEKAYGSQEGQDALEKNVILLHCTTEYPAPFHDINLRAIDTLRNAFRLPVGFSDHSEGISIPIAAVAMGAVIVEKHFTLDRNLPGPDHRASLEPNELKQMVKSIREVESAIGNSLKIPAQSELKNKSIARKSLVAAMDIRKGELFTEVNLTFKRPGTGISPMRIWEMIGKKSEKDYFQDEVITDHVN